MPPLPDPYRFGRFEVRAAQRLLLVDGEPARIGARALDVLLALLERRDRVVTKHELLELAWPGLVVEENNLQVQISTLRKLLGPQAVATIPGRGYRFTPPNDRDANAASSAPEPAPAGPSSRSRASLPLATEAAIGRDEELAELRTLVEAHRMVTIAGAGGIGKTRVALALADSLRQRFRDGVWWVELAALADPGLVAETVARTMGLQLAAGRPAAEALAGALTDLDLLLVLDNCEHLLDSVSTVIETVLTRAATVRVLTTSQEPLKTHGEHLYRLRTLDVPDLDGARSAQSAAAFSAVALFVERARAVDGRFRLGQTNVDAVAEICRRLDGIPLAIELAAARLPLMGVDGLRRGLDERFRLLTAGSRTVLRRHQTLRAAMEWSHGLLSAEERAVFRRLGVFSGGFTLSMAQRVAGDATIDEWAALEALGQLVDKSLVVADGGEMPRYRLLETTRAYAVEQLAAAGETTGWLRRHAQVLLDSLRQLGRDRWRVDPENRGAYGAEIDNLRAALGWAEGRQGDAGLAVALAAESVHVWFANAGQGEGLLRVRAVQPLLSAATPPPVAARYWLTYATLGVFSTSRECFEAAQRAADLWRELGDDERLYEALVVRAAIAGRRRDVGAASTALEELRRIEQPTWPPHRRASRAFAEWIVALNDARYEDARAHANAQANLNRAAGNLLGELLALGNVATCDVWADQPARAVPQLQRVVAELERSGNGYAAGHMVYNLAVALSSLGELDQAVVQMRRAYALLRREGDQAIMLSPLVRLTAARGRAKSALRLSGYAHALRARLGIDRAEELEWAEEFVPASIDDAERSRLREQGAALTEEQAFALALDG